MTITNTNPRRADYTGVTGTETVFQYTFLIFASSDLAVYEDATRLVEGAHYTVTGVGVETGGNVTLTTALRAGHTLTILSEVPATQPTHFVEGTRFPASVVERLADRLVALYQQGQATDRHALRTAALSTFLDLSVPDPVALRALRWTTDLTGLENWDPTTVLPASATLPLALTQGGTNATSAAAARVSLGLDGLGRKDLTNRTGVSLVLGDVVTYASANDLAVILDDSVGSKSPLAIALGAMVNLATGSFQLAGVATVNVTGTITRGHYLRKSATTKVAEDTGVAMAPATDPPAGAFAVALTGSGGDPVTAYCFGFTYPGATAPTITGVGRVLGLTGANNSGTPTTQFDVAATAAVVRDPVGGGTLVLPTVATRTLNISTAGPAAGGRDQAGAFSANTWIHAYLIAKTDGTYHVTASTTAPPTGPAFPTGYTLWAYLGALRVNNSSQLPMTDLRGAWALYRAAQAVVTDGRVTVETLVDCAAFVPPTAATWKAELTFYNRRATNQFPTFRVASGTDNYDVMGITGDVSSTVRMETTFPNVTQRFYYLFTADPTAGFGLHAYVRGYENPI